MGIGPRRHPHDPPRPSTHLDRVQGRRHARGRGRKPRAAAFQKEEGLAASGLEPEDGERNWARGARAIVKQLRLRTTVNLHPGCAARAGRSPIILLAPAAGWISTRGSLLLHTTPRFGTASSRPAGCLPPCLVDPRQMEWRRERSPPRTGARAFFGAWLHLPRFFRDRARPRRFTLPGFRRAH